VVALSTTEAEYYGSLNASTEANNYIRGNRETRISTDFAYDHLL